MAEMLTAVGLQKHILTLPDRKLPPSIPLVLPSNYEYDRSTNSVKKRLQDSGGPPPQLWIIDDAIKLMQAIKKPIGVLSICGPYRSGKSYFLSRTLGIEDAFITSHRMQACTRGIWMATTILEDDKFALLLLDTEGIDMTGSYTSTATSLLVLTTLISSLLIYNSMKVPTHNDLDKMSCFAQLSSYVLTHDDTDDLPDHQKHFPDLLWLLRDVDLDITDEDGEPLTPTEYIKSQVLVRSKDPGMCSPNDEVVKAIRTLFPSVECKVLPHPSTNPGRNPSRVSSDFNEALQSIIEYLYKSVRPKKGYNDGDKVDGTTLAALLGQYVNALNSGPQLNLESTWLSMVRLRLDDLAQKLIPVYENEMRSTLLSLLPIEEDNPISILEKEAPNEVDCEKNYPMQTLMGIHREILDAKLTVLQHEMDGLCVATEAVRSKVLVNFKKKVVEYEDDRGVLKVNGGILHQFVAMNYQKSQEHCSQIFSSFFSSLMDNFNQPFDSKVPDYMTRAVGPAKQVVFNQKKQEFFNFTARLAPGPPLNLRVVGRGHDRIKICWEPPTLHPLLTQHYIVEIRRTKDSGSTWTEVKKTKRLSALIIELNSDTKYRFRVCGMNGRKIGDHSNDSETETKFTPTTQKVLAGLAGVGGTLVAPATMLAIGAKVVHEGKRDKDSGAVKDGSSFMALGTPLSIAFYPGIAPVAGFAAGALVSEMLDSEGDLSDPESSSNSEEP